MCMLGDGDIDGDGRRPGPAVPRRLAALHCNLGVGAGGNAMPADVVGKPYKAQPGTHGLIIVRFLAQ